MRNEEFQEEDVWKVSREDDSDSKINSSFKFKNKTPSFITSRHLPTATKMIPNSNKKSISQQQHSAPVNIPNWSKIYGKNISPNSDADDEDGNLIPPHEWIARKLASSQISSFSVCEGAGRTLKGRDLSRVRNDVLTKTGFLES
ncbi:hypothetical protein ACJIZ3_013086 [Penstemon smallii]|uniref:Senescence regulator n=1 Tax=Penstemon smallii TaxID=265156 RepID=A0ABD3UNY8_9LAMI